METNTILELHSTEAQKVLDQYLRKLDHALNSLPADMKQDAHDEIISHIAESMAASNKETEFDSLLDALERLGEPDKYMKPMIADYEVERATSTFKPKDLFRAITHNIGVGITRTVIYSIYFILYLTMFTFVILFFFKMFAPHNTGLFLDHGQFRALGFTSDPKDYTEKLGLFWYPLMVVCFVAEYFIITILMKFTRKKRN